jgi:transcriptional regulator with XRE-family HTH domain
LTQKQLAVSIGVKQKQYQHWERGRAEPSIDNIQRLAFVLGVNIEWLLYGGNGSFVSKEDKVSNLLRRIKLFLHDNPQAFNVTQKMFELLVSSYKALKNE